jgi:hypothetical protein
MGGIPGKQRRIAQPFPCFSQGSADLLESQQIFLYTNELAERGVHKLEKKNVVFTKDGAKVGVKEISAEKYADKTQRAFVNTWNAAQDG